MRPQIPHPNVGKFVTFNPIHHSKEEIQRYGKMKIVGYEDAYYSRVFKFLFLPRYILAQEIEGKWKPVWHCNTDRVVFH